MSRHRVPNHSVDVNLGVISLYPQGSFYPLSDGNPTLYQHRITISFSYLLHPSVSQPGSFFSALSGNGSNHSEGTLERLRYPFGGDRPSQTPRLTLSALPVHGVVKPGIPARVVSQQRLAASWRHQFSASHLSCTCRTDSVCLIKKLIGLQVYFLNVFSITSHFNFTIMLSRQLTQIYYTSFH